MPSYNSRYIMLHAFVLVKHCGHHSWVVSCIYTGSCDTHDAYIELFVLLQFMFISRQNSPDNNRFICVNCRLRLRHFPGILTDTYTLILIYFTINLTFYMFKLPRSNWHQISVIWNQLRMFVYVVYITVYIE